MHDERLAVPQPIQTLDAQPAAYQQAVDQWQADLDQRIRDRAGFILSSAALTKLESFQSAQRAAASVFASRRVGHRFGDELSIGRQVAAY